MNAAVDHSDLIECMKCGIPYDLHQCCTYCVVVACSGCTSYGPCPDGGCLLCTGCQLKRACSCDEGIARRRIDEEQRHPEAALAGRHRSARPANDAATAAPTTRKSYKDAAENLIQMQGIESKRRKVEELKRKEESNGINRARMRSSSLPLPSNKKSKTNEQQADDTEPKARSSVCTATSTTAKRPRLNPEQAAIQRLLNHR